MMMLFWHPTGPMIKYSHGILHIEDLNPQMETQWTMSRTEMLKLGYRCIVAAVMGNKE